MSDRHQTVSVTQSTGKERAFAQRLQRSATSAVENRRISNSDSIGGSSKRASICFPQSFSDVADPLDFEDFILQHQPLADETDGISSLAEFPDDDIEVTTFPRKYRTTETSIPREIGAASDPHVKDCERTYTHDWSVVNRKYQFRALFGGNGRKKASRTDSFTQKLFKHVYEVDSKLKLGEQDDKKSAAEKAYNDMPRGSWASSIFDLQTSQPDELLSGILESIPQEDIDQQNENERKKDRVHQLFSVYIPNEEEESFVKKAPAIIPHEHFGQRILIKCIELRLDLDVEPMFAVMALYDGKAKRKISENFHFDMNKDWHKKMISPFMGKQDISSLARSCIFSVTYPSSEVFLVIKLEKALQQGDISECAEPYTKDAESSKNKDKAKSNAEQFCEKYGGFRMPFAWTAIHLIDVISGATAGGDSGSQAEKENTLTREGSARRNTDEMDGRASIKRGDSVSRRTSNSAEIGKPNSSRFDRPRSGEEDEPMNISNFRAITLNVSTFFKQESERLTDEDLFKFLADLRRPSSLLRRLKCIPGTLKLDISAPPDNLMYCLTPELLKVQPYPDNQGRPIKEIQEFAPKEVFVPYVNYRNTMYVYPTHLNFSNRGGSAKNIAVKVQFMAGEDQEHALDCIYGKSSGPEFVKEAWTATTYHNKTPDFYEEIKIKLPPNLDEKHHLLFTFYHISFKSESSGHAEPIPVGHTWLPALKESRMQLGEFSLPVATEKLPPSYSVLSTEVQLPGMKWVDGHKGVFNCSVHTESSIHTQDIYIHRFFRFCHQAEGRLQASSSVRGNENNSLEGLRKSIKDLDKSQEEPLVRFLHLIIDKLLMLLVKPPMAAAAVVNIGQAAFEALNQIVHRIQMLLEYSQDKHGRNSLLSSYVAYAFNTQAVCSPHVSPPSSPLDKRPSLLSHGSGSLPGSRTLSSSNPNLSDQMTGHGHSMSMGVMHEPWMSEAFGYSNLPGNRSSVAEGRNSRTGMPMSPFSGSKKLVHEELALQWAVASLPFKEMSMAHAWFFFELMVKSMAQYLENADKFFYPRKERFHERYLDDVSALINAVTAEVIRKQERNFRNARLLNASLAFFLNDIISLMDRGFVLMLLRNYMKEMNGQGAGNPNLSFLKLELLHILCTHEHYVILNLPFPCNDQSPSISPSPSMNSMVSSLSSFSLAIKDPSQSMGELSMEFREQHFLVGLLMCELKNSFDSNEPDLMKQAVDVIRDLIASHDLDQRYDTTICRNRIAALYLPLLAIVMDVLNQLSGFESEKDSVISQDIAMAIAMSSVPISRMVSKQDSRVDLQQQLSRMAVLNPESTRGLLLCCLWVFKNIDKVTLKQWWQKLPSNRLGQLLEVLDLCVKLFEYPGKKMPIVKGAVPTTQAKKVKPSDSKMRLQTLEEAILSKGAAREMLQRHKATTSSKDESPKLRWRKDNTYWKKTSEGGSRGEEFSCQIEGTLAAEASLIVLDALELMIQTTASNETLRFVVNTVMRVLLHSLSCNQSTDVLKSMFSTERGIVRKLPELLFEEDAELCADLCFRLLNHCCSSLSEVRSQASASLYLLMRQNFEVGNNFARVKMQVTMSLSTLVGSMQNFNEEYLRRSLKTIITYAQTDQQLRPTPFPEQVRELVFNLHMILSDTVKMKEYQEDPEMLIDLMYRIAKGYQNSPDLRLTWLQNMAAKHTDSACHVEAGMCLVHSAALVAEYLYMVEDKKYLPIGCVDFEGISYNALEESAVSDDIVSPEEEGICAGKYFSENGIIGLLEQAAYSFTMAQMYELVNEVYKILIKIYEAKRDHKKLASVHEKLADGFRMIVKTEGKRMMGTYFRVGFYGSKFGDIDGEEFVYKEPAITKLPEISHRLQSFYGDKFGYDVMDVIKDSSVVDPNRLDPNKAYIQITYVEPLFEEWELVDRITYFDKNNDLRRFMFVTPFTPSGKAHGDLSSQHKRKTILSVANAFPYIKTRINVIQREEIVLSPIEVAIEDIQQKTKELCQAIETEPPDAKMLQMVLQGCVGTTVNQGPMEIANVFLADFEKGQNEHAAITRNHHKLRLCFKEFVKRSAEALTKNKTLITIEQRAYQKELEKNYKVFVDKLEPLLKSRFGTLRGSLRKKDGTGI